MESIIGQIDLGFEHRFRAAKKSDGTTLVLLHGMGGNENDLLEIGAMINDEAALLSPRGKVMEGGRTRFFRRLAEGIFDLEDLRMRAEELAGFIKGAVRHYGLDDSRLVVLGYSNGANMAAGLALLYPGLFSAAVLFRAMTTIVPDKLPVLSDFPVFIGAGSHDEMIAASETQRLVEQFKSAGALVSTVWQPAGHRLTQEDVSEARDWLRRLSYERRR